MVHQSAAMPLNAFTSVSSRADRACLERAGRSQPANGRLRDAVGAGQLCLRGALREALHGLTALMGCERRRATEAHALRLRAVAAGAGSGEDQLALELGQPAEQSCVSTNVPSAGFTRSRERYGLLKDLSQRFGIVRGRCGPWCA